MIVWVNGTFGAGKTTVGTLLAQRDPQLRVFDPEWVGFMLRSNLSDHDFTDFQQLPSWRRLTPLVADELVRCRPESRGRPVGPERALMARAGVGALRARAPVFHVVLEADERVLRRRIDADTVEQGARRGDTTTRRPTRPPDPG